MYSVYGEVNMMMMIMMVVISGHTARTMIGIKNNYKINEYLLYCI